MPLFSGCVKAMALTHAHLYERIQQQADELAGTLNELRDSYLLTLKALSAALDARDRETEGHSRRVATYALMLVDRMGIEDEAVWEAIEWGALLHDVGKIGVPDAILHKPDELTDEEWDVMRRHPEIGHRILRDIPFLEPALPIVLHHHERWDGSGYPDGLHGEEIPDALDAMTSTRPYRPARSFTAARAEILRHQGTQFDPTVVDAFESIPEREWQRFAQETPHEIQR